MRAVAAVSGAFAAGVLVATVVTAGVLRAQPASGAAEPANMVAPVVAATPVVAPRPVVQVPGSVQVTRLTDTTFVVVKDQGDAQVVTLFTTEAGLVQKKHSGRFLY